MQRRMPREGRYGRKQKLSLPTENAVTFNLADAALRQEKTFVDAYGEDFTTTVIEINIAKNGTYIIKGSNEINGAFVDTHIKVEKGVEANIIFDGAQIQNNQMYDSVWIVVVISIPTSFFRYWTSKEQQICMWKRIPVLHRRIRIIVM